MHFDTPTRLAVVIPAYKPSRGLIDLIQTLAQKGFPAIVIVDDGSGAAFQEIFAAASAFANVHLLRHAVNLGKGAALKTAFNYLLCAFPELTGIVTADADGQHHPDDIESVAARLTERPDCLVLGSRTFAGDVPLRSRFGNIATRGIMHVLLGRKITDTQTGLRGIPASLLPRLMRLEASGYEFELAMLMAAHHLAMTIVEQPIRTIYEQGNKSSHFNPVTDSMKIYFVLLRFGSVSLATALIDNLVFALMHSRGLDVLPAQILGRAFAVAFNYWMVRSSVFYSKQDHRAVLPKYLALIALSGTASYAGIRALGSGFGISAIPAKLLVETVLFFVNFAVQRLVIFRNGDAAAGRARPVPAIFAPIAGVAFIALLGLEWHGFRTENLFAQEIWYPVGLKRFSLFAGTFLAVAVPVLMIAPWAFAGLMAAVLLILSAAALGPQAVFATAFFLVSACALGSKLLRAKDDAIEDHLLGTLLGMGVYIWVMTFLARQPVHYPWVWAGLLAVPLLLDLRGVRGRFRSWLRLIRGAELRSIGERAAFAALVFILMAHWFTAVKPEISADGLAMHLAVPLDMAMHHRMTFEPSRVLWSVMPLGADWCYSIVNLLGGESAAHLLVWCMLAAIAALLYSVLRRLVEPAQAWLLVALFAATPMVQLVTGSLFVENLLAAMILGTMVALWRFGETAGRKHLFLAMALGGTAMAVKLGALAFLLLAVIYAIVETVRLWKRLGPRPWLVCAASLALLLAAAAPTYVIAYIKTGNPVFPFLNRKYPSPLLDHTLDVVDGRYHQPIRWRTIYDITFHSTEFYEGQKGSFGFQYLVIVPMAWLGLLVVRRRTAVTAALVGTAAALVVLRSEPNVRYLYWSLPLFVVAFAGFLGWLSLHQRRLYRAMTVFLAVCTIANAWFLPSSSYYHKDFSLRAPFSPAEPERYLREAAPVRDVIAYYNRVRAGSAVLFTHDSSFAGTAGDVYENHWHQYSVFDRILKTSSLAELVDLLKSWNVQYFIARKPGPDVHLWSKQLTRLLQVCAVPEYERGDTYLARLDPACNPDRNRPAEPAIVAQRGFYDDFDPSIVFRGDWSRDEAFGEAARHTVSYTDIPGAEVLFAFQGKAVNWMFTRAPNRGIAEVTIDGVSKDPVDLYAPAVEWQTQSRYCCFSPGRHLIVIRVSRQAHADATGRFVDVDGFIVE